MTIAIETSFTFSPETTAVFEVREDGNSWVYENILVMRDEASSWLVYIKGREDGWEEQTTITCYVPDLFTLYDFLDSLTKGRRPLFSSIAEFTPLC